MKIYPNPTNGELNITLERNYNQIEISIFNSNGKKVLLEKNKRTIDINHLSGGIYLVKINVDEILNPQIILKVE